MSKPYFLLDIDGTLNPEDGASNGYTQVYYDAERWAWKHANHVTWLADLAAEVDFVWATNWCEDLTMLAWYAGELGLPTDLPVITVNGDGVNWGYSQKLPAVNAFLNNNPRPAIWLDDALGYKMPNWAASREDDGYPTLLVQADPSTGWTADQYAEITTWLGALPGEGL